MSVHLSDNDIATNQDLMDDVLALFEIGDIDLIQIGRSKL